MVTFSTQLVLKNTIPFISVLSQLLAFFCQFYTLHRPHLLAQDSIVGI